MYVQQTSCWFTEEARKYTHVDEFIVCGTKMLSYFI